ncbi:Deoxyadenosine kinase @ Deoxyguanosine kinase [uncultured Leptolyngbya sp.]|uniref:Deoxyadenosine kinase @ Deoxyguanosine kinase n=1 Tax=uncultured Leptolyngbya sp. TaxID=332963 RepID=A0A6J4LZN6_9CYAN|nr:Deoxyadenosine kinase @ Deoxyguanosine kinase [uncultured Leptolyngbya sp.]
MAPQYIVIEGVIGVGKTTLAKLLARSLASDVLLEVVEENPFLQTFYADRAQYAFQTESFFLLSRYRQQLATVQPAVGKHTLVSDYMFAKNRLFAGLNLQGDEWRLFLQLYDALSERVPQPDLVVYLQANVRTLMTRIAYRDRPFERNMEVAYIEQLRETYDRFFASYTESPLLMIQTDDLNLVNDEQAQQAVMGRISAALAGYQQGLLLP